MYRSRRFHFIGFFLILNLLSFAPKIHSQEIPVTRVAVYTAEMTYPTDLDGDKDGNVYILDGMNGKIVKISRRGKVSRIVPNNINLYKSVGIDWYDGSLYIADTPRHRLIVLDKKGRLEKKLQLPNDVEPVDLLVLKERIFVSDRKNHQILTLNQEGKIDYHWGSKGQYVSDFLYPGDLELFDKNNLAVVDILNSRIMLYTLKGRYPRVLVESGVVQGTVYRPKGIARDSEGKLWVVDSYTGSMQAFLPNSDLAGIAVENGNIVKLTTPIGLFIDKENNAWVVESMLNQVSRWKIH